MSLFRALFCGSALMAALYLPSAAMAASSAQSEAKQTQIHEVAGFLPDLKFILAGKDGKDVTEQSVADKVVLMFFGYANCPDICPTTMGQLALVAQKLGDDAQNMRILFISVDPHRDRPEQLQAYVNMFDPNAIGLSGTERQVAAVARRYRVAYQIEKPTGDDPESYLVTHGRGIYVFDRHGKARFLASDASSVNELADRVRTLLHP